MSTCEFGFVHPSASHGKDCFIEACLAFLNAQTVPKRYINKMSHIVHIVAAKLVIIMHVGAANTATKQSTKMRSTGTDWDGVRRRNVCFTSLGGMGAPAYDSDFQGLPFLTSDFIWGTGSKQSVVQLRESVKPSLQKLLNIATDMGPSFDSCTPSEWAIRADVQKALKKIGWKADHIVEAIEANYL
eukprot:g28616.t1